jgi:protein-S-isoprenylcysteine O-methyltransferase Ste14
MAPEPDTKTPPNPNEIPPWEEAAYKQGSDACRNYSQLTMRTRTLAQQILATATVALGVATATSEIQGWNRAEIFIAGGVVLLALAFSLLFVDWHYQSAFTAIRNSLAYIESRQPVAGHWLSHLNVRTQFKDHIASYFPFLLLAAMGCLSVLGGLNILRMELKPPWHIPTLVWTIPPLLLAAVVAFFWCRCVAAGNRDHAVNEQIGKTLKSKVYELNKRLGLLDYVGLKIDTSKSFEATARPWTDV